MSSKTRKKENSITPVLLNYTEAAKLLRVSEQHLLRLNEAGKIPAPLRLGKSVRWSKKELEDWVDAGGPGREEWERIKGEV